MKTKTYDFVIILVYFMGCVHGISFFPYHPDTGLNINQLTSKYGYGLEIHEIETANGYILTVHRITHGRTNYNQFKKPVVFMMHGIFECSVDWINAGPGRSLGYLLADEGYDIWMGNARGNADSRKHRTLNPDTDKEAFWDFSWHEIGYYDLPAMIDYALINTNQTQLQYIGFSQGTTTFFVMGSSRPEYNNKIRFATLFGPAAELTHMSNPFFRAIAPFENLLHRTLMSLGQYELLPRTKLIENLGFVFCRNGMPTEEICKQVFFAWAGTDRKQFDDDLIPVITTHTPAGSSLRQFIHFGQIINGPFRQFDYHDWGMNIKRYGTPQPPEYDLGRITAPVAIYYGMNDILVTEIDAKLTATRLPNVVRLKKVDYPEWTHLDFIWAKDATRILYKDVIRFMNKYNY